MPKDNILFDETFTGAFIDWSYGIHIKELYMKVYLVTTSHRLFGMETDKWPSRPIIFGSQSCYLGYPTMLSSYHIVYRLVAFAGGNYSSCRVVCLNFAVSLAIHHEGWYLQWKGTKIFSLIVPFVCMLLRVRSE